MSIPLRELKSDLFRGLAHPIRIQILERLALGERTVQTLQEELGLAQPIVSQHLAALRTKYVVTVRREGVQAHYALRSPLIADILKSAREFLNLHLADRTSLLRELKREARSMQTS